MGRASTPMVIGVATAALSLLSAACGSTVRIAGDAGGVDVPGVVQAADGRDATDPAADRLTGLGPSPTGPASAAGPPGGSAAGTAPAGGGAAGGGAASGIPAPGSPAEPAETGGPPTAPEEPSARQVDGPTDPIDVGIILTRISNADSFGVSLGNTVSEDDIYAALIRAVNEEGGIAGRPVNPIYAATDTGSTSWDQDMAAACATFTQDHHVAAVLGYVFGHFEALEGCLADQGIPHLSTTFAAPDQATYAQYPLLLTPSTPSFERRSLAKAEGGLATGLLTPASRIGVVLEDCPIEQRAYERTVRPQMQALGLTIASEFTFSCANGAADAGSAAAEAGGLVLRFRAADVDTIMVQSRSEGPAVLVISLQAESQGWRPTYVVSSLANTAVLGGQMPEGQARNVHGFGWLPTQDVNPSDAPPLPPPAQRCIDLAASQGVQLTSAADHAFAFNLCEALFLYGQALTATGGDPDGPLVIGAIEQLGTGYVSTLNIDGASTYGPGRHDGPAVYRQFGFEDACSCFRYRAHQAAFPG